MEKVALRGDAWHAQQLSHNREKLMDTLRFSCRSGEREIRKGIFAYSQALSHPGAAPWPCKRIHFCRALLKLAQPRGKPPCHIGPCHVCHHQQLQRIGSMADGAVL